MARIGREDLPIQPFGFTEAPGLMLAKGLGKHVLNARHRSLHRSPGLLVSRMRGGPLAAASGTPPQAYQRNYPATANLMANSTASTITAGEASLILPEMTLTTA